MSKIIGSDQVEDEGAPLLGASQRSISAPKIPGCIAARHTLVAVTFFGLVNVYMMRVNLSVALVAMVDLQQNFTHISSAECPGHINSTDTSKSTAETFDWDEDQQNQILSSFFYGYILTQIPGGWIAGRFGGKWPFGIGVLCTAVLTLLTPLAASAGIAWFIALRVLEGVGEGVTYPALYAMLAHWAPPLERTNMLSLTTSGAAFGTILAYPIAGVLCDSSFLEGWPSVFYLSGALGLIWFLFWVLLVFDTPAKHPRISQEEKEYIQKSIGPTEVNTLSLPLVSILTSVPVWAIILTTFCVNWGFYTLLTNLPNYLKNILKLDVSQSGFLSALPYVFQWISQVLAGIFVDFLRRRGYITTTVARKLFNSLGAITSGLAIVLVGYVGCDKVLAIIFLCVGNSGIGLLQSGVSTNQLEIAPKYAGIIMGIANTAGTAAGFLGPTVVGVLTEGNNTRGQWQIVFWICFGFFMLGLLIFLLMSSGEVQPWAVNDSLIVTAEDYNSSQYNDEHSINPDMAPYR